MNKSAFRRLFSLGLLLWVTGCSSAPAAPPDPFAGVSEIKLIATVSLPAEEIADTQNTPATLAPPPSAAPATAVPTVYVGVFLGENASDLSSAPVFDAARFATPAVLTAATATAASCQIQPDPRYGSGWTTSSAVIASIGCPGEDAASYIGSTQVFENGVMFYIPSGEIWAITIATLGGQYWYTAQAPEPQALDVTAPEGLRVPVLGFGGVWAGIPGVRQAIGFAATDEEATEMIVQRFTGGVLLRDGRAGQTFALLGNGSANGPAYGPF